MRAQIAITRNGVTQASSDKAPPDGGILARRTNGDFRISLHRHVSETALIQMMRALRALDLTFEMSLEMAGNVTGSLSRQEACLRLALRALGILERANEPLFMSNLERYDSARLPAGLRSEKFIASRTTRPCRERCADCSDGGQRRSHSKSGLGRAEPVNEVVFSCASP